MAEEPNNLILRPLRDIREKQDDQDKRREGIDRRPGDLTESAALAMGMAAHSHVSQESLGRRPDGTRIEMDSMKERLDSLDKRP